MLVSFHASGGNGCSTDSGCCGGESGADGGCATSCVAGCGAVCGAGWRMVVVLVGAMFVVLVGVITDKRQTF